MSDMALRAAIREGAAGLVHKSEPPERLLQAIAAAAAGGRDFPAAARRQPPMEQLTKREYALLAIALGGTILAVLPVLLQWFGSGWKPGVPTTVQGESSRGSGTSRERVPGRASRPV